MLMVAQDDRDLESSDDHELLESSDIDDEDDYVEEEEEDSEDNEAGDYQPPDTVADTAEVEIESDFEYV